LVNKPISKIGDGAPLMRPFGESGAQSRKTWGMPTGIKKRKKLRQAINLCNGLHQNPNSIQQPLFCNSQIVSERIQLTAASVNYSSKIVHLL